MKPQTINITKLNRSSFRLLCHRPEMDRTYYTTPGAHTEPMNKQLHP